MLAYEFAIRNERVIELLSFELTEDVAKELIEYGLNTLVEGHNENGSYEYLGFENLYLDYDHLEHLGIGGFMPDGNEEYDWKKHFKVLSYPQENEVFIFKEDIEDAVQRIKSLIEGRGGKLQRLMDGTSFKHYDAVTFFDKTVYSLDTTINTAKTIRTDIKFIKEWIQPDKYLQLLQQNKFDFD